MQQKPDINNKTFFPALAGLGRRAFLFSKRSFISRMPAIILVIMLLAAANGAQGQTTWNGSVSIDWSDPANWSAGVPTAAIDITIPNGLANYPVIGNGVTATCRSITDMAGGSISRLGTGSLTIAGNAGGVVIANITGIASISCPVSMPVTTRILVTNSLTISGIISGVGSTFQKDGPGVLILSGLNSYNGQTWINAGTLRATTLSSYGTDCSVGRCPAGEIIRISAATLQYTGPLTTMNRAFVLAASGATIDASGSGTLTMIQPSFTNSITGAFNLVITGTGNAVVSGVIAIGVGSLTKTGTGTWTLSGLNTYTGQTLLQSGTIIANTLKNVGAGLTSSLGAPTTALNGIIKIGNTGLNLDCKLVYTGALASTNRVIELANGNNPNGHIIESSGTAALTFTSAFTSTSANSKTLTLQGSNAGNNTISGAIPDNLANSTSLVKNGTGTWILSGANSYTGGTTITAGTLRLGAAGVLADAGPVILNGGTLSTISFSETMNKLTLSANSTIALGVAIHSLNFANSSGTWPGGMLTVTGWTGLWNGTSGTAGKIFVGSDATGLTSSQLDQIQFFDGTWYYPATILSTGEVVPGVRTITTGSITMPSCSGSDLPVPFTYKGKNSFPAGTTTFIAELSDITGSFASPVSIGSIASNASGSQIIIAVIPAGTPAGTGYRVRVVSNSPVVTGTDNGTDLTIIPGPVVSITGSKTICVNGTTTLSPTSGGTWVSNTPSVASVTNTGDVLGLSPGTVTFTFTETATGCSSTTLVVTVSPLITITGPSPVPCKASTGNLYTTESGMSNYVWDISPGGVITAGQGTFQITVTWNKTGPQWVSVNYTDGNGCTAPSPFVLNFIIRGPTISGPTTACVGDSKTYTTEAGKSGYTWTFPGATLTAGGNGFNFATITWTASGSRIVTVRYPDGTCNVRDTLPVIVYPIKPFFSAPSVSCINAETTYIADPGQINYVWTISAGGAITAGGNGNDSVTVLWQVLGVQTVTCSYNDPNPPSAGCTWGPTTWPLTVMARPVPGLSGPTPVCINSTGNVYTTEPGKTSYVWVVTGGNITGGLGTNQITVTWNTAGLQSVSVNYSDINFCTAETPTVFPVTVNPLPTITGPSTVCEGSTGNVYTTEAGFSGYDWEVSAGGTITAGGDGNDSVTVTWDTPGPQTVTVIYIVAIPCTALVPTVYNVTVNPSPTITTSISPLEICEGSLYTITAVAGNSVTPTYELRYSSGTYITPPATQTNTTGIFTVDQPAPPEMPPVGQQHFTVKVTNGDPTACSDSVPVTVEIWDVPHFTLVPTCSSGGSSGTITVTGAATYPIGAIIQYRMMQNPAGAWTSWVDGPTYVYSGLSDGSYTVESRNSAHTTCTLTLTCAISSKSADTRNYAVCQNAAIPAGEGLIADSYCFTWGGGGPNSGNKCTTNPSQLYHVSSSPFPYVAGDLVRFKQYIVFRPNGSMVTIKDCPDEACMSWSIYEYPFYYDFPALRFVRWIDNTCPGGAGVTISGLDPDKEYVIILNSCNTTTVACTNISFTSGSTVQVATDTLDIQWWTALTGGTLITTVASGTAFNPYNYANSGVTSSSCPGTYVFYASCGTGICRQPAAFTIRAIPIVVAGDDTICSGSATNILLTSKDNCDQTIDPGSVTYEWYATPHPNVSGEEGCTSIAPCAGSSIALSLTNINGSNCNTVTFKVRAKVDTCWGSWYTVNVLIVNSNSMAPVAPANAVYTCPGLVPAAQPLTTNHACLGMLTAQCIASDNGGAGCPGNPFIITRTWTFTDKCGPKTVTQTIRVVDSILPAIVCAMPLLINIEANNGTTYVKSGSDWDATGSDNCSTVAITWTLSGATTGSGSTTLNNVTFNEGTTTVLWTVTDACGNFVTCSFTVVVYTSADLQITKTALPDPGIAGQQLTYMIVVANSGPAAAKNVVITDDITAFPSPEFSTDPGGPWNPWISPYNIPGDILVGDSDTLYIRGTLSLTQCSPVSNTASVTSSVNDPYPSNNSVFIITDVLDQTGPVFTLPTLATGYCVEGFISAEYLPGGIYYVNDLNPPRRDYYTVTLANPLLDLSNITDNCPGTITIDWTIDFGNDGSTDLFGTGQISLATPFDLPLGDNLVTWTVTDASGNVTIDTIIFKVLARPDIN